MKRTLLKTSLLAIVASALAAHSASAQITVHNGDLILGVEQLSSGAAVGNDYEVDLGSITKFTTTSMVDLSSLVLNSDLSSTTGFGSGYPSASGLQFSVVGDTLAYTAAGAGDIVTTDTTIHDGAVFFTQVAAPTAKTASQLSATRTGISSITVAGMTPTPTTAGGEATFVAASNTNSYSKEEANGGGFFTQGAGTQTFASATSPVISLYLNNTGADSFSGYNAAGSVTLLGSFSFVNGTDFVYNGVNAVPEPSSSALILLALGAMALGLQIKRRASRNS